MWSFQYGVIPRLLGLFLLYGFTITYVEAIKKIYSKFMQKWLGFPQPLSLIYLYKKDPQALLTSLSMVGEFKATKVRTVSILLLCEGDKPRTLTRHQEAVTEADNYLYNNKMPRGGAKPMPKAGEHLWCRGF